jgi:tetratricopeptide (TPR) repeat protein
MATETTLLLMVLCLAQTVPEKLIDAGHWKRARAIVEVRIRDDPQDALANFLLSQIRNAFGDHESPLHFAEKAVAIDGQVAKYHRQLAEVLGVQAQNAGIFQQLVLARRFKKEIDTAISLDGRDPQALRDLMEFYLLAPGIAGGDKAKAHTIALQIVRVDPAEGFSAQARLAAFNGGQDQIEPLLRKAVEAAPANYRARIALANFYTSPENASPEGVEQQARQALAIDPGRADAYAVLAGIYAAHGQWTSLDSVLAAAEKEVPDDLAPFYRAAKALLASNRDLHRAIVYFRKYLRAEPEGNAPTFSEAHWKLGLTLEKLGQSREALAEWRESIRLDRDSPAREDLKRVKAD